MNNKVVIALSLLFGISFITGGFACLYTNFFVSPPWVEGIVGMSIGSCLFFFGVFGFTRRDMRMKEKTSKALGDFFRNFDLDGCEMEHFWLRYTYLTDQEIKDFLEGDH